MGEGLNETETMVLLALARLGPDAYGMTVRREIETRSDRPVSIAAVYAALDRLQRRGLAESTLSDPIPERGGRARKYFALTKAGALILESERLALRRMWEGIDLRAFGTNR